MKEEINNYTIKKNEVIKLILKEHSSLKYIQIKDITKKKYFKLKQYNEKRRYIYTYNKSI